MFKPPSPAEQGPGQCMMYNNNDVKALQKIMTRILCKEIHGIPEA